MKSKNLWCFVPLIALMMLGCENFTSRPHEQSSDGVNGSGKNFERSQMFDSSYQKDDPYTVENMQAALDSLINSTPQNSLAKVSIQGAKEQIEPNFMYVRFLPKGRKQKEVLLHTGLVLWEYPLDYKEENRWKDYVDKDLPDSVQAFYTSVPVDYPFDNEIEYHIIKKLFIPQPIEAELDSIELAGGNLMKATAESKYAPLLTNFKRIGITLTNLEIASRSLTGNLNSETANSSSNVLLKNTGINKAAFWSRWRPKGTLKFRDTERGDVPVEGVRVTAGYSYYWRSSKTDANGYFVSPERWTYSVKYEAHWDTDDFLLEDGESWYGADLYTEGPTSYSDWNRTFIGNHSGYASIFSGAYTYYYKNVDGLPRPHQNGWFSFQTCIAVYNNERSPVAGIYDPRGFTVDISIYISSFGRESRNLYAVVIHELSHSAHYEVFEERYAWMTRFDEYKVSISEKIKESYAMGAEWYLVNKVYPNFYPWGFDGNSYTPIFIDLQRNGFSISDWNTLISKCFYNSELRAKAIELHPEKVLTINLLFNDAGF